MADSRAFASCLGFVGPFRRQRGNWQEAGSDEFTAVFVYQTTEQPRLGKPLATLNP